MNFASERELQPGQVIAERYRLEAPIGRGAMGAVWRGVHVLLESPVAIKFLNAAIASDPEMLDRFMREARSAAAVRSSHVVQIFDYGVDGAAPYIAMELLVGEPLDQRLAARGTLEPPELDKIIGEVARAVSVAHELGVVHRDIKPANIFIAREGDHEVTKVLDFGIAKLLARRLEAPAGSGTHTGMLLGTPNYMSPEQARGQRTVDHRSDLWSLAVLAFECLTGRQPFESRSLGDMVVKICTAQPLVPSAVAAVPLAFDAWFSRGMSKDPAGRFQSATEMADALHALLAAEGLGAESRPRSTPPRSLEPLGTAVLSQASERQPVPAAEVTRPSLTARAVAAEVRVKSTAPKRRLGLAAAAILPLVALGIALAASTKPPSPIDAAPAAVAVSPAAPRPAPAIGVAPPPAPAAAPEPIPTVAVTSKPSPSPAVAPTLVTAPKPAPAVAPKPSPAASPKSPVAVAAARAIAPAPPAAAAGSAVSAAAASASVGSAAPAPRAAVRLERVKKSSPPAARAPAPLAPPPSPAVDPFADRL